MQSVQGPDPNEHRTSQLRQAGRRPHHHLRHHAARRRAVARLLDEHQREDPHGRGADRAGRRRAGGRLRHRLARRLRKRQGDLRKHRPARRHAGDRQPGARRQHGRAARSRGTSRGKASAHPHRHRHQRAAHEIQAADGARRGDRRDRRFRDAGAPARRRRGVVGRGRDPQRHRLPVPLRRGGDPRGCHHDQPARYGRLRAARGHGTHVHRGARARAGHRRR